MCDPVFTLIDEAKRLRSAWGEISGSAEREFFALSKGEREAIRKMPERDRSPLYAAAEATAGVWCTATQRVKDAKPATLAGVVARLRYLAEEGEFDFEAARDVLARIAERQPGLAVA